jgi:hypothetical protein
MCGEQWMQDVGGNEEAQKAIEKEGDREISEYNRKKIKESDI